ncbi:hypothetical protein [Mangrovimonas xylaniphaga]|uniref:hypothetical protein n=1 Tax=Mangrovimonas xylaniphaga TaxID=1645915 RepID=UPI0006B5D55E|nr:hypothetical protein [Mangrovimonas xylaniphaga]
MKTKQRFGLIALGLTLSACQFNQSVNKDLITGAYSRGNGIGTSDISIEINGTIDNRNSFIDGEKINLIFNDVTGLNKEDGKAFPGMSMLVVKNATDTILNHTDLFADLKDGTDFSPLMLQANFMAALPHGNNETYKAFLKIWDKKGTGTFEYELPFSVSKNEILEISENHIQYSDIYLWDDTDKLVVVDESLNVKNKFVLILEGLEGFKEVEGKVHPALSIEFTDSKGTPIIRNENILEAYTLEGIDATQFRENQLPITLSFTPGQLNNPFQLKASLSDLNSDSSLYITSELILK